MKRAGLDEHAAIRRPPRPASDEDHQLIDNARMILTAGEAFGGPSPG